MLAMVDYDIPRPLVLLHTVSALDSKSASARALKGVQQ